MAKWRKWIRPGLITTFAFAVLAILIRSNLLEEELAGRVAERLANDGHGWAEVDMSGRSVILNGVSPSTEAQAAAVLSARRVEGVISVSDASELLPLASPYIWSVKKAGSVLTLSGSVPSEGFRTALLAAARRAMPDAQIHDQMQFARGASSAFNAGTAFVLNRLAYFEDGTFTISDSTLSVAGVSVNAEAFAAAPGAFREGLPAQLALGPLDILPARADPFVWSADFDGQRLALAGYVPDDEVEGRVLETAADAFPGVEIDNAMQIASGAPKGFPDAARFAIGALTRFDRGGVALDGMLLDITGKAKTVEDYDSILTAFSQALPPGMRVVSSTITPATVSDYGWRGTKAEGTVTLTGFVPTPEARDDVGRFAADLFGDVELVNEVRIAAGEPRMDWIGAIKFAMRQLGRLDQGSVFLDDRSFSIEGVAESSEAFTALLNGNTQTLPASLELARADIRPPAASPFRFSVMRRPGAVEVGGHVESEADRDAIIATIRDTFGTETLEEHLIFASGAPDAYLDATKTAVHAVSRLAGGRFDLNDSNINITGGAYYPAAAGALADSVGENMPAGFNVALSVELRQPEQPVDPFRCRDLLAAALSVDRIEFDGGNREISEGSYGALDRVAATVERCPDALVEIAAHTDSDGSASHNLELSQARADAILEYLVDAGIRRERMTAVGHGEANPIADNATEEGKAANRRIEFVLAVPEDE